MNQACWFTSRFFRPPGERPIDQVPSSPVPHSSRRPLHEARSGSRLASLRATALGVAVCASTLIGQGKHPSTSLSPGQPLLGQLQAGRTAAITPPPSLHASNAATVVARKSAWHYFENLAQQGAAQGWQIPPGTDPWNSGVGIFGYGDPMDVLRINKVTLLQYGSNPNQRPITTYFRRTFQIADASLIKSAMVKILLDDGAVIFINGKEVLRPNMLSGTITHTTTSATALGGCHEWTYFPILIDHTKLVTGLNSIAVEIHQWSAASSDIGFDLELSVRTGPPSLQRGPYLQRGGPANADPKLRYHAVRWRTDFPTDTRLWLGSSPTQLALQHTDANLKLDHEVVMSGLSSDTVYFYAIGNAAGVMAGGDKHHYFRTAPPPNSTKKTRVWVIGDSGTGLAPTRAVIDGYQKFVTNNGNRTADVWLTVGDNAYFRGTDSQYQTGLFDMFADQLRNTFFMPAFGNHDWFSADSLPQCGVYYDIFTLPKRGEAGGVASGTEAYYSYDHNDIHFICLDSYDSDRPPWDVNNPAAHLLNPAGAMLTWLKADLAQTQARWIIAYWHHPPYSRGSHDSDNDSEPEMGDMRRHVLPVLEAAGVDLVLTGHSHGYERSYLLDGHYQKAIELLQKPQLVLDRGNGREGPGGDGFYAKPSTRKGAHEGAVYAVVGSSGWVSPGTYDHPAMAVCRTEYGSMVIDVDGDTLVANFIDIGGVARDRFVIRKGVRRQFARDLPRIPILKGGAQKFQVDVGQANAGNSYLIVGSFGTTPGFNLGSLHVPLNPDPWFDLTLAFANTSIMPFSFGKLDANGRTPQQPAINLPPLNKPHRIGIELYHAALILDNTGFRAVTNTVKLTFGGPPPAPTKLQAVRIMTTSAILYWMYTGDNEQGFDIEVSLDGTNFSRHTRSGEDSWYNQVVGLTPATTYWFRVTAMNTFGSSAPSNVLLVRTPAKTL